MASALVSRRDDLDHRDDLVIARVADHDRPGLGRVDVRLGMQTKLNPGRRGGQGDPRAGRFARGPIVRTLQREDVWAESACELFGQGIVIRRQQSAVQDA